MTNLLVLSAILALTSMAIYMTHQPHGKRPHPVDPLHPSRSPSKRDKDYYDELDEIELRDKSDDTGVGEAISDGIKDIGRDIKDGAAKAGKDIKEKAYDLKNAAKSDKVDAKHKAAQAENDLNYQAGKLKNEAKYRGAQISDAAKYGAAKTANSIKNATNAPDEYLDNTKKSKKGVPPLR